MAFPPRWWSPWRSIQSRWELFHTVRTFSSIAAVVVISGAVAARLHGSPSKEGSEHGGAVAGERSA